MALSAPVHTGRQNGLVTNRRLPIRLGLVLLMFAVVGLVIGLTRSTGQAAPTQGIAPSAQASVAVPITVDRGSSGHTVPKGFVSFSIELSDIESYTGTDPKAIDPVFVQLLRSLDPNQTSILRLGGDSTDHDWYPIAGVHPSGGIQYSLSSKWMSVVQAMADELPAKLILGLNLEADSRRIADAEATAMRKGLGKSSIDALEIGNEPELYGSFSWYKNSAGQHVFGRPHGYNMTNYIHDFGSFAASLPGEPIAGPSFGGFAWLPLLGEFLSHEHRVTLTTIHAYPLKRCRATTILNNRELLSESSSYGFARTEQPFITTAHRHGKPIRIDEMNAVSCGGMPGVSNSFGSALWAVDTLFELVRTGVNGVNFHTRPGTINEILGPSHSHGQWTMRVHPEYYGLLMFAQAAPAGAQLLRLSGHAPTGIKVWATKAPDGHVRVVLINNHLSGRPTTFGVRVLAGSGTATMERLSAPSVHSQQHVTLGGQSFGTATSTGRLAGKPVTYSVIPRGHTYVVRLPAASAALLTLPTG
jgi:hypothetical protein